ncbi:MAG: hypothetical protein WAK20_03595 [Candidatus Acidiferrum sp.]
MSLTNKTGPDIVFNPERHETMISRDYKQIFWWLLIVAVAFRLYFVRELLAALSLFTLGFVVLAVVVSSLYLLQRLWNSGISRLTGS